MLSMKQSERVARCYWRWRHILGSEFGKAGRNAVGAAAMTLRKFPNISKGTVYRHAKLWEDVYGDGQRLPNLYRPSMEVLR